MFWRRALQRVRGYVQCLHIGSFIDYHLHQGQSEVGDEEEELDSGTEEDFIIGIDWTSSADALQR